MPTKGDIHEESFAHAPLRLRADLHWSRVEGELGERWRVKDPVALEYHEFGADERFLLNQFDGARTLEAVRRSYNEQFRPKSISKERLLAFAAGAHDRGLLLSDGRGQGGWLRKRNQRQRRAAGWSRLFSALFVRLPGVDPNPALRVLEPLTRWFWSPWAVLTVLLAALATLAVLAGRAGEVAARLPTAGEYLQAGNLAILAVAFVVVKAVHELAHGLACRHVGARCHEIGVVLVALAPCLYCDVTDVWMVRSRAARVLVSAAGMYAEVAFAVLCAWLWMFAGDGLISSVLLSVMVACGVSTLLFNANPLLKLDGYFILSDLADTPNLHERASRELTTPLMNWFRRTSRERHAISWPLVAYAVAALVYRVFIVAVLAWAAHAMLSSFKLRPVGDLLVGLTIVGLVAAPVYRFLATLRSPAARRALRWGRVTLAAGVLGVTVAGVLALPLPHDVSAPAVFEAHDARPLAAAIPGRLVEIKQEGDRVDAGGVVARLENPDLELRRVRLAGALARAESMHESLRRRTPQEPRLLSELPTAQAAVNRAADDLRQLDEEIDRLAVRSPIAGVVVGVARPEPTASDELLPDWQGRLTDAQNAGCWVEQGDLVCLVAPDPTRLRATLVIDSADTRGVREGLPARLLAYQSLAGAVRGEVAEVARTQADRLPEALGRHPELLKHATPAAAGQPLAPVLLARVDLAAGQLLARHSSHGRCKIELASESLGAKLWRWAAQTFPLPW